MKYTDDQILNDLRQINYPDDINIVDPVMQRLQFVPAHRSAWNRWGRHVAAACLLLGLSVGIYHFLTPSHNDKQINEMFASAYNMNLDDNFSSYEDLLTSYYDED